MKPELRGIQAGLFTLLQRGIPLTERPFEDVGRILNLSEGEVLASAASFLQAGLARRFGAVFDSRALGYASTLCAVDAPVDRIEAMASSVSKHPGVTHCYEREGRPNLWFTLTAQSESLSTELEAFGAELSPHRILNLPAVRRFKIDVVFDLTGDRGARRSSPDDCECVGTGAATTSRPCFSLAEKEIIRRIQKSLPLSPDPFRLPAEQTGHSVGELLALLRRWREAGVLRRIAFVAGHRKLGFQANGMCMWPVEEARIVEAGVKLASLPVVTHCYARVRLPEVPYTLYAMIHEKERDTARALFERISSDAGLSGGQMLLSVREFKKSSPQFFC